MQFITSILTKSDYVLFY